MNQINLAIALCLFVGIWIVGCSKEDVSSSPTRTDATPPTSPQSSTKNESLTTDRAQKAIDKFMAANAKGTMTINGGIREIPSENSAVADVVMENFTSNDGQFYTSTQPSRRTVPLGWTTGTATFSRYTDGKWVLSQIVIVHSSSGQRGTFKPNIEVN